MTPKNAISHVTTHISTITLLRYLYNLVVSGFWIQPEQIRTLMAPSVDYESDLSSSLLQTPPPVSVYPNLPQSAPDRPKAKRTTKDQADSDECFRYVVFALLTLLSYLNYAH